MKPKQHLFELIKSLSSNEKRYFKLYCSLQKGNKNYLKLFTEIDSQQSYDESLIKLKFKNEKFIKQLTFTKNYLYKLILQSLISYEGEKSVDMRIMKLINAAKILLAKGLIVQYFDTLDHALKISSQYERLNLSLQILELRNIYTKLRPSVKKSKSFSGRIEEEIRKISNYHSYNTILKDLIELYRSKGKIRSKDLEIKINKIERHELLKDASQALTYKALENYHFIRQLIADFRSDPDKVFMCAEERLKIITKYPEPFVDMNINHVHDILGYILSYFARKKDKRRFNFYINKLNSLPVRNKSDEISLFFLQTYLRNVKIIIDKDWILGVSTFKSTKEKLDKYSDNLEGDIELLIRYQFVIILIMSGQNSSALEQANNLMAHPKLKVRTEMEWYVRLLIIVIHFQLKNFTLLNHLFLSTKRYLHKKNNLFKLEMILLTFIKKVNTVKSDSDLRQLLLHLREEMQSMMQNNYEKNAFRYFDFIGWTDKQISELDHSS